MKKTLLIIFIFSLSGCGLYNGDNGLSFFKPYYMKKDRVVKDEDIKILQYALKLLSDENQWNRQDDRLCFYDEKWSLFCALAKASIEVDGKYKHRRVALQEVRFTIDKYYHNRWKKHQLQDFNNHEKTNFDEIKKVLIDTKKRLKKRFDNQYIY